MTLLTKQFYLRGDVVQIAKELLGKWVFTKLDGAVTGGMITETEAYAGPWDRACHAYNNRHTKRTHVLFLEGGIAYIYFCYGIHYLLNVVTSHQGIPQAVLIRSISFHIGTSTMMERRKKKRLDNTLTSGPGSVCQALGIDLNFNGHNLQSPSLWIEDRKTKVDNVIARPRIGIDYAKEDAHLPWRFRI